MKILSTKDIAATRFTCVVYGQPGVGKTSLAKSTEEKTLIISAESGLLSLAGSDIDVVEIVKWDDIYPVVAALKSEEMQAKYKWIFVDSLTEMSQKLLEVVKAKPEYSDPKKMIKLWGEYADRITAFVKLFRDFKPYNVVFTALEKFEKDDIGKRFVMVDMPGSISMKLPGFFDEVFRMTAEKDSHGRNFLFTEGTEKFVAKDRSGRLAPQEQSNLAYIYAKIKGDVT